MWWLQVIGVILGGLVTMMVSITVESLRRPRLKLRIAPPVDKHFQERPASSARFLYLELMNEPLSWWARWMSRNAALQCHGEIMFHHLDGQNVFGRAMPIRWSTLPEPVASSLVVDGKEIKIVDLSSLTREPRIDVYPGEAEPLDTVTRFDDEDEAYGWNNETYFSRPIWRNPDWKLPSGRYLIKVTVRSSGETLTDIFRVINDVGQKDFRLEPKLPSDSVRD